MAILTTPSGSQQVKIEGLVVSDQAPSAAPGYLEQVLSWLANRIRTITGETSWLTAPAATLSALWGKFHATTGHKHDGTAGNGPKLSSSSITFRGALVNRSTGQSIPSDAWTALSWNAASYNTSSFWSAGSPTRLTVPAGVTKVRLTAGLDFYNSFPELIVSQIWKNGLAGAGLPMVRGTGNGGGGLSLSSAVLNVSSGDYFTLNVYQANASAQNTHTSTWFAIEAVE